ncbi:MAG: hypothetical protein V1878_03775 [bacterium]
MRKLMRILTILPALVLLWIPLFPCYAGEERATDRLVILYTGETHGNVEPCG